MKNVGIVSLGSAGTMGHMALTTKLSSALQKHKKKVFLISEYNYKKYSNENIFCVKIPQQKHMKSVGGCVDYEYKKSFINVVKKNNIGILIFSTFYDLEVLKWAREESIKTILVSYPLRDSHREAIKVRKYYSYFDKVFTLKDVLKFKKLFPNEEIVAPIFTKILSLGKESKSKTIKKILITCGGGGRPSSKLFFQKIKKAVPLIAKKHPEIKFTIILGNSKEKINLLNTKVIKWSRKFPQMLLENDLIIGEAGFYTLIDLISLSKQAILIPGERRIDNQELRAVEFEANRLGFFFMPVETPQKLCNIVDDMVLGKKKIFKEDIQKFRKKFLELRSIDKASLKEI